MSERNVTITPTSGPLAGQQIQATINDPSGNPFTQQQQGNTAMVPFQQQGMMGNMAVILPSGQRLEGLTQAQVTALQNEATLMMQQRSNVVDLRQGNMGQNGDNTGPWTTYAEAGLALSEWFQGREAKRLLDKTFDARQGAAVAEKRALDAIDTTLGTGINVIEFKSAMTDWFAANRQVNDYQDDISFAAANQAYWRAAGGAIKTVDRLSPNMMNNMGGGGGGGPGWGGSNWGGVAVGVGAGFLLSEVLDRYDDRRRTTR